MKLTEAVQHMSKFYLQRIIDSFAKDFPKSIDEEKAREIILRNVEELTAKQRVANSLQATGSFSEQLLLSLVLESLIHSADCSASEEVLADIVMQLESGIIEASASPDSLRYENHHSVDVLRSVLEVALEDNRVSDDELRLVSRLREKLKISERSKRLIMAQLNHFPRTGNAVHTPTEIRETLLDLQKRGIVFYCNKLEGGAFVIPEEIETSVRASLGIELSEDSFCKMLRECSSTQLGLILENEGLPKSGTIEEKVLRLLSTGLKPSACLAHLSADDIYNICRALPGVKVSGSKQDRIERIIDHFASLVSKDVSQEASPGEIYYQYLIELANRDRENLLANKVIKKDKQMDNAFEEGTRYLFREVLGITLVEMSGNEHPDGCFQFGRHNELLMWDNKSKESEYAFPDSHLRQFKRYIRDSKDRVSCFLVIVPVIADGADHNTMRLKVESGTDTDVAIITAEDLLYVSETWRQSDASGPFNAEVFNMTGILSRRVLNQRMKLFL